MDLLALSKIKKLASEIDGIENSFNEELNSLYNILLTDIIRGTATDGMNGFLEDITKTWSENEFVGKELMLEIVDVIYPVTITSNTATKLYFDPIMPPTSATVTLGSGEGSEGQVEISLIGDLSGDVGNGYSVEVVAGTGNTGMDYVTLDEETKVFTILVDSNGQGEPRTLMAGSISVAITEHSTLSGVISTNEDFVAGNIPFTESPILFTGGDDGIRVSEGDTYEIAYSLVLDVLKEKANYITAISDVPLFIGQEALVDGVWYKSIGTSSSADWKVMTA